MLMAVAAAQAEPTLQRIHFLAAAVVRASLALGGMALLLLQLVLRTARQG
jgi:hypothetical protein